MKIAFSAKRGKGVYVLPIWEGPKAAADEPILKALAAPLKDFTGKNGETALVYHEGERVVLLGLGQQEKASVEALRKAYASLVKLAMGKRWKRLDVLFPKCRQKEEFFRGIVEGILFTNYSFTYKHDSLKENPPLLLEEVTLIGVEKRASLEKWQKIAEGLYFVRDLVNENSDAKTPQKIAEKARHLHPKVKTTLWDRKKLEKEKMGLILAVNRSSPHDPYLIEATYRGDPKNEEHVVLIGKGITYDTGGLSLKPTDNMLTMKCDMAGAATVLGVVRTIAELGWKINVTALTPVTENCIGSNSYKPGDVYRSYSGKTVEITNTDAEGRLVLADTISYAVKNLKPTYVIDLATLTGACVVALGEDVAGLFSNSDELAEALLEAAEAGDEPLWRLPLYSDYLENYKSDIADLVNSGGRDGSAIKAALFLQEFVGNVPWAHLDIAGPAFLTKPKHYHPAKGTGYGLRLLLEFLERRAS